MSASPAHFTTTPTYPIATRLLYSESSGSIAVPAWQVEDWQNEYRALKMRVEWLRQRLEMVVK